MKRAEYWYQNRHIDQWNQIEDPDMNLHRYGHMILYKEASNTNWKKTASSTSGTCQSSWLHIGQST